MATITDTLFSNIWIEPPVLLILLPIPSAPAAEYCDGLTYAGYSDWYLPAIDELVFLNFNKLLVDMSTSSADYYMSSTETSGSEVSNYS